MRKNLLIIIFTCASIATNAQSDIDVLHYHFQISINDRNDTLYGVATIKCAIKEKQPAVQFDLASLNKRGTGMMVTKVDIKTDRSNAATFSQENDHLIITSALNKGDTAEVVINYKGIPSDGLIISKNKYGDRTFFADNWPNRAHNWIPCADEPGDKATFEFIVNAPSHYTVISNGIKSEEKDLGNDQKMTHWVEDVPLSTKVMVIGVAKFAIKEFSDSPAGIPVSAWVYPQDSITGFRNYAPAPAILKFLSAYIGPYPYNKLANVQSKTIFGGMENASAIFYDESSGASTTSVESLLAHEITHQWFGDMASEKSFPHLWLSEGFATYLTHIYIESKYGTDSLENEMEKDRRVIINFSEESNRPVVDSASPLMALLNANSYQKGGWILHMLRRQLGDTVFHTIIRNYYASYSGKNAETRDFEMVCEKTSGKNLRSFFDQWLYSPGLPKLDVQWKYDSKKKIVLLKIKQLQNNLFQFPLDVEIKSGSGKSQWETLSVTNQNQQFTLRSKEKPAQLRLDPKTSLLFAGSISMKK